MRNLYVYSRFIQSFSLFETLQQSFRKNKKFLLDNPVKIGKAPPVNGLSTIQLQEKMLQVPK